MILFPQVQIRNSGQEIDKQKGQGDSDKTLRAKFLSSPAVPGGP